MFSPGTFRRKRFRWVGSFWVMDERTEALMRFDVTEIVHSWESGAILNLGLVLRITDSTENGSQTKAGESQPTFSSPKAAVIECWFLPAPARKGPDDPRGRRGKEPRSEDGRMKP